MNNKMKHIFFTKRTLFIGVPLVLSIITLYSFFYYDDIYFKYNPKKATFSKLERIRKEKKAKVTRYLDQQKTNGEKVSHNDQILDYFKKLYYLYKNNAYNSLEYNFIEDSLNKFFVTELDKFYDILFIDNEGDIFFTIKKEDDFLGNVYEDRFNGVSLYEKIRNIRIKEVEFIDYEYYSVSDEPASFFISPVLEGNNMRGYIVQYEKSFLRFGIFATHNSSSKNIIRKLIDNEIELSQIKILFKYDHRLVNVIFDYRNDQAWTQWGTRGYDMKFADEYRYIPDFGKVVKSISNYNSL